MNKTNDLHVLSQHGASWLDWCYGDFCSQSGSYVLLPKLIVRGSSPGRISEYLEELSVARVLET